MLRKRTSTNAQLNNTNNIIYLIDYQLCQNDKNGLDIIEELHIQNQAILVTGSFDENLVRKRCESLRVKILPKTMISFVPIVIS